jgi:hypothetical protein
VTQNFPPLHGQCMVLIVVGYHARRDLHATRSLWQPESACARNGGLPAAKHDRATSAYPALTTMQSRG